MYLDRWYNIYKVLITTSHRPTRNTRRFVKVLSKVIPYSKRVNRGKLTLKQLALQAIDSGFNAIIVVRNRKGNPGYIDFYSVAPSGELIKECTLRICGYAIPSDYKKLTHATKVVLNLEEVLQESKQQNRNEQIDELKTLDCIIRMFNVIMSAGRDRHSNISGGICMHITTSHKESEHKEGKIFDIIFTRCSNNEILFRISVCNSSRMSQAATD